MGLNAVKTLNWDSTDLSATTNTSEIIDVRDVRTMAVLITLTGAPTGTLNVIHYYGFPTHTPTGKSWATNDNYVAQTFTPSAAAKYIHTISATNGTPCSAYQLVYTKTSGTGAIRAIQQNKGGGST